MPRFAANLTFLWPELELWERLPAAAAAGFTRVEILFVHDLDRQRLLSSLRDLGLELVLFDTPAGSWDAGERGLLCLPGREAEFLDSVRLALDIAAATGTTRLNALAGICPPGLTRAEAEQTAIANLRSALPLIEGAGVSLLIENINHVDMPGYLTETVDDAARLVTAVDHPLVGLQLDQYHVGMVGADAVELLRRYESRVRHVQIADVPGRHQPGTGGQPIGEFLAELDRLGYPGSVGLEYRPQGPTDQALSWLPVSQRG